jgi:hypothetical protein
MSGPQDAIPEAGMPVVVEIKLVIEVALKIGKGRKSTIDMLLKSPVLRKYVSLNVRVSLGLTRGAIARAVSPLTA